jgi:NTE family protein
MQNSPCQGRRWALPTVSKVVLGMRGHWPKFPVPCLRHFALIGAVTLSLHSGVAQAESNCPAPDLERPGIGLALGGGGARGSAHIGILRLLEEMRVPVDYVAGTSMGSLVGAMYATGMGASELETVVLSIDWDLLFEDDTDREDRPFRRKRDDDIALYGPKLGIGEGSSLLSRGAISGQKISFLFETLVRKRTSTQNFSNLPIPYRAITTDLATGKEVVLSEGDLALAMRASMSVPGVFDPVVWDDYLLVDGGLVNNVPLDVVRDMGADIVIAVDVGTGLTPKDELTNMVAALGQLTSFLTTRNVEINLARLEDTDILIQPPLGHTVTSASFSESAVGIGIGYEAAQKVRGQLQHLAISESDYHDYQQRKQACATPPQSIDFVRLDNRSRFADEVILERVTVQPGDALDYNALEQTVSGIYALGFLDLARYEIVEEENATGLILHVTQDSRGTQFIETGLDFSGDGDSTAINLRLGYLNTALDDYGSEFRALGQVGEDPALLLDVYKYVNPELKLFAQPRLFAERREFTAYEDGDALLTSQVNQYGGALGVGREFGSHSSVSGGIRLFQGSVDIEIGPPGIPDFDFDGGEYFLQGTFDRVDDRYFPGDGALVQLNYFNSQEGLGADAEYEQLALDTFLARSYQRHSVLFGARYYETIDGTAPPYALFRAGGFARLSGYRRDELNGQNFGMLLGGYRYHFAGSGMLPAFLGGTVEYGKVAEDSSDLFDDAEFNGSLYFGYRSPLGPLYIGVGAAEGGLQTYFFHIGNIFGNSSVTR